MLEDTLVVPSEDENVNEFAELNIPADDEDGLNNNDDDDDDDINLCQI